MNLRNKSSVATPHVVDSSRRRRAAAIHKPVWFKKKFLAER